MEKFIYVLTFKRKYLENNSKMIFDIRYKAINMAKYLKKTYNCYVEFDIYKKSKDILGIYELQPTISVEIEEEVNK